METFGPEGDGAPLADVPVPPLQLDSLVQQVRDAQDWYMTSTNPEGTFPQRVNKRNAVVRGVFGGLRRVRKSDHEKHRVEYGEAVRCKCNETQDYKGCPSQHDFGPSYEILDVHATGQVNDIQKSPPSAFGWHIGANRGDTKNGTVWGSAKLNRVAVERGVESDVLSLRAALAKKNLPDDLVPDIPETSPAG